MTICCYTLFLGLFSCFLLWLDLIVVNILLLCHVLCGFVQCVGGMHFLDGSAVYWSLHFSFLIELTSGLLESLRLSWHMVMLLSPSTLQWRCCMVLYFISLLFFKIILWDSVAWRMDLLGKANEIIWCEIITHYP